MNATQPLAAINSQREHQLVLEQLYDKNQLMPRVRQAFKDCERLNFEQIMNGCGIPSKFGFDMLAQMAIRKRANVPTLIGCLRHHCEKAQEVANLLEVAVANNLVEWSSRDSQFIVIYGINQELQEELDRFQFPLPMIIPPEPVEDNLDTGYLTERSSVILRDNHTDDDVCLDHLNRLNQTAFSLNLDVANTIQNQWRGLDRKKDDETWEDFKKRRKAFEKYNRVAKDVIQLLLKEGNKLFLTHRYDKRGRSYCMGFHITYQGTDWNKSCLEFHKKEVVLDK